MVRKIKPTKEEIKASTPDAEAPDEFLSIGQRIIEWMGDNSKLVLWVMGITLGSGLLYGLISVYQEHVSNDASGLLSEVAKSQSGRVDISGEASEKGEKYVYESEKQKSEAVRTAAEAVIKAHKGHEAANMARLYLGSACMDLADLECAETAYRDFLKNTSNTDPLTAVAKLGLGSVLEQKGDKTQAASEYVAIASGKHGFSKDLGLYQAARVLATEDKEKAIGYLEQIETDYPDSKVKPDATRLLESLK